MRQSGDAFARMRRLRDALMQTLETERRKPARARMWQPPMDLTATEEAYVVRLDLPGAVADEIDAGVEDGVLRVHGSVRRAPDLGDADEVRLERAAGAFGRSLRLPADADASAVTAKLDNGVLTIRIGRRQKESSQVRIEIE